MPLTGMLRNGLHALEIVKKCFNNFLIFSKLKITIFQELCCFSRTQQLNLANRLKQ